jgi:hypothetical protein
MRLARLARRLLAVVALAGAVSGCTINVIRNPKEPEILKQQISYYKWLYEKGVLKDDPALMRDAARVLMGLKIEKAEKGGGQVGPETEETFKEIFRRLLEDLDEILRERRRPPGPQSRSSAESSPTEARLPLRADPALDSQRTIPQMLDRSPCP